MVGDVLSRSASILVSNPVLLLLPAIPSVLGFVGLIMPKTSPSLVAITTIVYITSFVVSIIIDGAYPLMVKAVVDGGRPSVAEAIGRAYHRFWSLLAAGILVGLIVGLGFIALVVPGIIFLTWYAYTGPAIMLDGKGAMAGMTASRAFGRDKKWRTFEVFLAILLVGLIVIALEVLFAFGGSRALGQAVGTILLIPVAAWGLIISAYTYISYGPSSVPVSAAIPTPGTTPQAPTQPATQPGAPPSLFCTACGSAIQPGAEFCGNCGKAV